jgi:hypothetical protein
MTLSGGERAERADGGDEIVVEDAAGGVADDDAPMLPIMKKSDLDVLRTSAPFLLLEASERDGVAVIQLRCNVGGCRAATVVAHNAQDDWSDANLHLGVARGRDSCEA